MKTKIKEYLFLVHSCIEKFFYRSITEIVLPVLAAILGISSWAYPVFNIWIDVVDKEFSLIESLGYIIVGIILLYTGLSLNAVLEKLKKEKKG